MIQVEDYRFTLSLTMHRKTGSSDVIDNLHKFGYGVFYTETLFIEDKLGKLGRSTVNFYTLKH